MYGPGATNIELFSNLVIEQTCVGIFLITFQVINFSHSQWITICEIAFLILY